jgi:hypothetical protein
MTGDQVNTKWNANFCDEGTFDGYLWLVSTPLVLGETHILTMQASGTHAISMVLGNFFVIL